MLEFGVGRTGFASHYARHFKKVYGLDIYDYSEHHPGVDFLLSDGQVIPLPDEAVDFVVSHSVLEHVGDLGKSIAELNRVLGIGGFAFISVSPLYYASEGSHVAHPAKLENWEHLDPSSDFYLLDNPIGGTGDYLNKLTSSLVLSSVGGVPWDIVAYERRYDCKPAPQFSSAFPPNDVYTREFRLLAHKRARFESTGPVIAPVYLPNRNRTKLAAGMRRLLSQVLSRAW